MQEDCVFCKIASGAIPVQPIYEDDDFLAFPDQDPQAPIHALIIPKVHYGTLFDVQDEGVLGRVQRVACEVARRLNAAESGFRLLVNVGPDGGQFVPHLHYHLMGGRYMDWPPG